jgi:hypothetical protein
VDNPLPWSKCKSKSDFKYETLGHYCRFLYRIMKFEKQYEWFKLSDNLTKEALNFKQYIEKSKQLGYILINNIGNKEAGTKVEHNLENNVEKFLAEEYHLKQLLSGCVDFGDNPVYRQLPVGLFKVKTRNEEPHTENMIFTGGKSAIDLWSWKDNTFHVIELKANNKMVGIITEIFFYSNYMYDLLIKDGLFTLAEKTKKENNDRGYHYLLENEFEKINGIMLADEYHPIVNEAVLKLMNDNSCSDLKYYKSTYSCEISRIFNTDCVVK